MTQQELIDFVQKEFDEIMILLKSKGSEYAKNTNAFENFERAARIDFDSPINILRKYKLKHDVSLIKILDEYNQGILPNEGLVNEKIRDILTYLLILKAMFKHYKN